MARLFPSSTVQANSQRLRNDICRLATPRQMAEVSSHLRNFAVAEVIGFIAALDGHPQVISQPVVHTARAAVQQARGTFPNPFAHAIPSDLLLNGDRLISLYHSPQAKDALQRVFGMGIMAPEDWEDQPTFPHQPRQNNVVDTIAERYRYGGGLVDAFQACGEVAVRRGVWNGSGKRRHDLSSLTKFIAAVYESTWVPRARAAYAKARSHFALQFNLPANTSPQQQNVLEQRREILEAQMAVFERETNISPEAARNVWKFAVNERWN